jgi:hypothetical protein
VILIVVAAVIVMVTLIGLSFVQRIATEHKAVNVHGGELQRASLVDSGIELLAALAEQPPAALAEAGGLEDNPDLLRGAHVCDDPATGWHGRFTVLAPRAASDSAGGLAYGAVNESARLNLAVLLDWDRQSPGAGSQALMALPGMTESVAAAVLDWIDGDDQIRPYGAEAQHYSGLSLPYGPRNGVPASLDELLLVRGVGREMLLGPDRNANFQVDPEEMGAGRAPGTSVPWASLLTVYSAERNITEEGLPRIHLNQADLRQLHQAILSEFEPAAHSGWADFIVLYRQFGPCTDEMLAEAVDKAKAEAAEDAAKAKPDMDAEDEDAEGMGPADDDPAAAPPAVGRNSPDLAPPKRPQRRLPPRPSEKLSAQPEQAPDLNSPDEAPTEMLPPAAGSPAPKPPRARRRPLPSETSPEPEPSPDFAPIEEPLGDVFQAPFALPAGATAPQPVPISSLLDLVGAKVLLPAERAKPPRVVLSPFTEDGAAMRQYLPALMDRTTLTTDKVLRGKINLNLAPREVLLAVPGMDGRLVEQVLASRQRVDDDSQRQCPAWPLLDGLCDLQEMKALLPYVTTRGDVYRAQVVGFFEEGGAVSRTEVVIDATASPARQVYRKDLRLAGQGHSWETLRGR